MKTTTLLFLVLSIILSPFASADNAIDQQDLQNLMNASEARAQLYQQSDAFKKMARQSVSRDAAKQQYQGAINQAQASLAKAQKSSALVTSVLGESPSVPQQQAETSKNAQGIIIFVSLGMPAASLRQIMSDAIAYHVPVVIRGLLQNNWQLTVKTLYGIIHPEGAPQINGSVEIDPKWFHEFGITQVPAFVAVNPHVHCEQETCPASFDVLYGNIPLRDALNIFKQKGVVSKEIANALLQENPNG